MTLEHKLLANMFPKGTLVKFLVGLVGNAWCLRKLDDKSVELPDGYEFEVGFVTSDPFVLDAVNFKEKIGITIASQHGLLTYSADTARIEHT